MNHLPIAGLALAALTFSASAQVAPGESAYFFIQTPGSGIEIVDNQLDLPVTPVTKVEFASAGGFFYKGEIDPATGDIWATGSGPDRWKVFRMTVTGSELSAASMLADLSGFPMGPGGHAGLADLALDIDGNVFVCETNNIWRVDRNSGAVTLWASGLEGVVNALTIDRATNTMWSASFSHALITSNLLTELRTFDIDAGPSMGSLLLDLTPSLLPGGIPQGVNALAHDGAGTLYVGNVEGLYSVDTTTTAWQEIVLTGISSSLSSLEFDTTTGLLHTGGGSNKPFYSVIDPATGIATVINKDHECIFFADPADPLCFSADIGSGIALNNFTHTTQVLPHTASNSAGYELEISANGKPGDFAVIAFVEAVGIPLASPVILGTYGICDIGGRHQFSASVPGNFLSPAITSLGFQTLTHDFGTGVTTLGGLELLHLNP